jgi:hypothetical protein
MTVKISSSQVKAFVKRFWPYAVAAIMIGYVIILTALVKADVAVTSGLLRLS